MKKSSILALAVAPLVLGTSVAVQAQSVSTDPVGFVKTELPAGQLTPLGINLLKPAVASGKVISIDGDSVTLSGEVSLDAGKGYYLEVADGNLEGDRVDVANASGNVITLNLSASHNTIDANALEVDSRVVIRPHVTFGDITDMIGADNLHTGNDTPDTTQLLTYDEGGFVVNAYFDGVWYDAAFNEIDNNIIAPGTGLLFRNAGSEAAEAISLGEVRTNNFILPLKPGLQMVSLGYPVDRSPNDYGMNLESFTGAEIDASEGDQVLTLTPSGFDINVLYSDGVWYDGQFNDVSDDALFAADGTVLLRKIESDPDFVIIKPY